MSEKMTPLSFRALMRRLMAEYDERGEIFGVHQIYKATGKRLPIFGEWIETPIGPAAGPNSQLAQNIIAAYAAGARFFEVKTVQKMDGEALAACIPRPCILADDEGYNQEWSTELTVKQAMAEYIKAWCAIKVLAEVYGLGDPDGFVINLSVGYDLDGIRTPKMDAFLEGMKDASGTEVFQDCISVLHDLFPAHGGFIDSICPYISRSVTVSTLHGCPPEEIERIAAYLLEEKGLNTFVKCNPTLLGYETTRATLDDMGYDYVVFDKHHFLEDLQYRDAIPMFRRLNAMAKARGLSFGLKLSNTLPVDSTRGELPGKEMYMSGRSLFPLTIELCRRISEAFDGTLRISYAGGADWYNCTALYTAGIWPITVATTILQPGGYNRLRQMADALAALPYAPFAGVDCKAVAKMSEACRADSHYRKPLKLLPHRKNTEKVPLLDCAAAPCKEGCPIGQDIPEYLELVRKGLYDSALSLICEKNPLPFITGTICAHRCQSKCTRNFCDEAVTIRQAKLLAATRGFDALLSSIQPPAPVCGKRAAIIGGGPTGMAAAYFLARAGVAVTIFEQEEKLGGIVRYVIPDFRISDAAIDKDEALLRRYGAEIRCGAPAPSIPELKAMGYTHILLAVGAHKPGRLNIPGNVVGVLAWMKEQKRSGKRVAGHVAIVGAGNTAMDAARLALRCGAASATIVYRRTKKYMPADPQELALALADGVSFLELSSPFAQTGGRLICEHMTLGMPDASGRRRPERTEEFFALPCNLVISAVGEQVDEDDFARIGITAGSFRTELPGVYLAGDALRGPATVVEGIADAQRFADIVIGASHTYTIPPEAYAAPADAIAKKGVLATAGEGSRCLSCNVVCETCVDVCPNRANTVVILPDGRREIVHLDALCNECGNCIPFCPYASAPCHDKFTLFSDREAFLTSHNPGVLFLGGTRVLVRLEEEEEIELSESNSLPVGIEALIMTIMGNYSYLLA